MTDSPDKKQSARERQPTDPQATTRSAARKDGATEVKDKAGSLAGQCLIAMPSMSDPWFASSLIYLCAHSDEGAMGLIVNRPAPDVRFADLLDQLDIVHDGAPPDVRIHLGGPVEPGRGFVLHSGDYASPEGTAQVEPGIHMTATIDILSELASGGGPASSMLALGYAGWGPGQLEGELAQNAWITCPSKPELIFGRAHEFKWSAALKSIKVDPVALSATSGRA